MGKENKPLSDFTIDTLALQAELKAGMPVQGHHQLDDAAVEIRLGKDSLWIVVTRPGKGGFTLRTAFSPGGLKIENKKQDKRTAHYRLKSSSGTFNVIFSLLDEDKRLIRVTVDLTPSSNLLLPYLPRDLYPISNVEDPTKTSGHVEAAQRGINTGLCYFSLDKPAFGKVMYFQNLTSLNDYFTATKTKPDGVVGGEWPALGYQPPTSPISNSPPKDPLVKGKKVILSDAFITFDPADAKLEDGSSLQFMDMLGRIYPYLDHPETQFHNWPARASKTARNLDKSPKATITQYGQRYLHPYTASEYPDSMVQMTVAASILNTKNEAHELGRELLAGMSRFYDKKLGTLRRYLPNVGKDKDRDAVDSWYLYHPLTNLGRLALKGDKNAKTLFLKCIGFAIKSARHFKYKWPIQYNIDNFKIITKTRGEEPYGQTDVGGIHAYVMLQAYEITGEKLYLNEAKAALKTLKGLSFNLTYQTNLTALGAVACIKLAQIENNQTFMNQSYTFMAGLFHNSEIWDSKIDAASHYQNFFGVACLHNAPYMAIYECFEVAAALNEYLEIGGDHIPESVRLLLLEHRKYAFDRAWYFYPDALPKDILAKEIRNGHIDPRLSFPLEDLYGDGQPAGQVGQEIYGCGAAFILSELGFIPVADTPLIVFSEYPVTITKEDKRIILQLSGPDAMEGRLRLISKNGKPLPRISLHDKDGQSVAARSSDTKFRDYRVFGNACLNLIWK